MVAFQGESGAFSEAAARELVGGDMELLPCRTFDEAVRAVVDLHADFAVMPVENLIAGPVHASIDAMAPFASIEHLREHTLPVQLALVGLEGATLDGLVEVSSHPVAIAQCGAFLAAHPAIRVVEAHDTAGAARMIALRRDASAAAIAAPWAAARYGLSVIAEGIQDRPDNWTRFTLVRRRPGSTRDAASA